MASDAAAKPSLFAMLMKERPTGFAESVVFEDDHTIAFLDKFPLTRGHTLVVPKEQVAQLHELSGGAAAALGAAVAKVAAKVVRAVGCADYNVVQNNGKAAGQEIPHVHFHIMPRFPEDHIGAIPVDKAGRPAPLPDVAFEGDVKELRDAVREA